MYYPLVRPFARLAGGALLAFVVIFWRLGAPSFWDPDEAHYAETTRELVNSGDWLAPYYNEQPFFDKPVFFHWLQALPMGVGGPTEAAARLVPALAALALAVITWWVGSQLAGSAVGVLAALLLIANPGTFGLARYAILDLPMTALLFGGVSLLAVAALRGRPRLQYAGYVLIGLATCVKGPLAVVLCGLTFVVAILLSAEVRRLLLSLKWIRGLLIVAAIAAPWFVLMLRRFDGAFVDGYFLSENIRLFAQPVYGNQPGWWFYLAIIGTGFLPWTWIIAGRLSDQIRRAMQFRRSPDALDVMLWSWVLAIVGFFSFSQFKLDHYVYPAAPALCLLCARGWTDLQADYGGASTWGTRLGVRLVGPTLVVGGLAIAVAAIQLLALPSAFLIVPGLVIALGAAASIRYLRADRFPSLPSLGLAALGVVYVGALVWVIPQIEREKVIPDVARWVAAQPPVERVATFRLNRWNPAYRFYVDRHVEMLESDEDARRFFSDASPYYCVMTEPLFDALRRAGVPLKVVYRRNGLWATSGRMLWRQREQLTTFVVVAHENQIVQP